MPSLVQAKPAYRELLQYMEDKRKEARERLIQDDGRKEKARRKEDSWALLRLSTNFLKEQEGGWRQRRIEECDKIREEEKRDRLAVVREKKKRYGLKKLSKEENQRIRIRTEERLEVARAKENLWKRFRGEEEDREMEEDEIKAWENLREGIMELEEEGVWRNPGKEVSCYKRREVER